MDLRASMRERRGVISSAWLEQTLQTYPPEAAAFFRRERDRFANPVGATLAAGLENLLDRVLAEGPLDAVASCAALQEVLEVRAVQSFTPAQAVGFLFLLKGVLRQQAGPQAELEEYFQRIDQLALFAFDIFVKLRERIYQLRVEEVKRNLATLIKHADAFVSFPDDGGNARSGR